MSPYWHDGHHYEFLAKCENLTLEAYFRKHRDAYEDYRRDTSIVVGKAVVVKTEPPKGAYAMREDGTFLTK